MPEHSGGETSSDVPFRSRQLPVQLSRNAALVPKQPWDASVGIKGKAQGDPLQRRV